MEKWKDVIGYKGFYQVSNFGNVRKINGTILTQSNSHGYRTVRLTKNKLRKNGSVHRMVAEAFIPNPKKYLEINHIHPDKTLNTVVNLEWCSRLHNVQHANKNNLINYSKKLTENEVKEIRKLTKKSLTNREIACRFGISDSTVCEIKYKKTWRHV